MQRISLSLMLISLLIGCNSDNDTAQADANTPSSPPAASTPPESTPTDDPSHSPTEISLGMKIKAELERAYGDIEPQLDRTDSVPGTDADDNGVRDDIDALIARVAAEEAVKRALTQMARAFQNEMTVDWEALPIDEAKDKIRENFTQSDIASECLIHFFGADFHEVERFLQDVTFNTKARTLHYLKSNQIADGMGFFVGGHDNACE